ncbi:MAG: hypothetical protein ACFFA0_05305 [Promethearchaeota archaeon]
MRFIEYREGNKIFYEAMWFSSSNKDEPVIRGVDPEIIIKKMLKIISGDSGFLEVYKITSNNLGYSIELFRKFHVLNKLDMVPENY